MFQLLTHQGSVFPRGPRPHNLAQHHLCLLQSPDQTRSLCDKDKLQSKSGITEVESIDWRTIHDFKHRDHELDQHTHPKEGSRRPLIRGQKSYNPNKNYDVCLGEMMIITSVN